MSIIALLLGFTLVVAVVVAAVRIRIPISRLRQIFTCISDQIIVFIPLNLKFLSKILPIWRWVYYRCYG